MTFGPLLHQGQPWIIGALALGLVGGCAARHSTPAEDLHAADGQTRTPTLASLARDLDIQLVDWAQGQSEADLPHDLRLAGGTDLVFWIGVYAPYARTSDACLTSFVQQVEDKLTGGDEEVPPWIQRGGAHVRFAVIDSMEGEKALQKAVDNARIRDERLSRAPTLLYLFLGETADGSPTAHLWGLTADRVAPARKPGAGDGPEWFVPRGDGVVAPLRSFVLPDVPLAGICGSALPPEARPAVVTRCAETDHEAEGLAGLEAKTEAAWNVAGGWVHRYDARLPDGTFRSYTESSLDVVLQRGDVTCGAVERAHPVEDRGYCATWSCSWTGVPS